MSEKYFLAIHANRIALLKEEKRHFSIEHLRTIEPNVKPLYILKSMIHGKKVKVVTGLSAQNVLLRSIHLKLKSQKEILAALPFQIESIFPFSPDELVIHPAIFPENEGSEVYLLAATKEIFQNHLEQCEQQGFDPDIVSAAPLALFRFGRYLYPRQASLFTYDPATQVFVVAKDGRLVTSQTLRQGDLGRVLALMQKKYPSIEQILVVGDDTIETPLQVLRVENSDWIPYATAIGLTLDAASNDAQSGQLRHGKVVSHKERQKRRRNRVLYFAFCGLFTLLTLFSGKMQRQHEEGRYLEAIGFEGGNLKEAVFDLESSLQQKKKEALSLPTIPRVYEVITWLSTHPQLQEGASITRFRYQITKSPRLGTNVKTYGAKVDLEFAADDPLVGKNFHNSLLAEKRWIDQKQNIGFTADQGVYRVSFHLKARSL